MSRKITVWINNFNRLTSTQAMVEFLGRVPHCSTSIIDNASTYPPLLEWYDHAPCEVVRLNRNMGHLAPWLSGLATRGNGADFYAVTDPDLDLSNCPADLLEVLRLGLERYPERIKAGLGLEIGDLPARFPWRQGVIEHESQFWSRPLDGQFFDASVDTTFALYRTGLDYLGNGWSYDPSLRANHPYVARHRPWYLDFLDLDEEERHYFTQAGPASSMADRIRDAAGR